MPTQKPALVVMKTTPPNQPQRIRVGNDKPFTPPDLSKLTTQQKYDYLKNEISSGGGYLVPPTLNVPALVFQGKLESSPNTTSSFINSDFLKKLTTNDFWYQLFAGVFGFVVLILGLYILAVK